MSNQQRFARFPLLQVAARYCCPVVSTAHAIHAIFRQCDNGYIRVLSPLEVIYPRPEAMLGSIQPGKRRPSTFYHEFPDVEIASFADTQQLRLPPEECCRGTSPNQDAMSRPFLKAVASPTAATRAVEMMGPIPGTPMRRLHPSLDREMRPISPVTASVFFSSSVHSSRKVDRILRARGVSPFRRLRRSMVEPSADARSRPVLEDLSPTGILSAGS